MPIDYSKWKTIEVSDDEDDTHPNIDTPSLFRWRHQARLERMAEFEQAKKDVAEEKEKVKSRTQEIEDKINDLVLSEKERIKLELELKEIRDQEEEYKKKEMELTDRERLQPWNVDTIGHTTWNNSRINKVTEKSAEKQKPKENEDEIHDKMRMYFETNEKLLNEFSTLEGFDALEKYLIEFPHLASDFAANWLTIEALNLAIDEKYQKMARVSENCITLQFLLELSKSLNALATNTNVISSFFKKIRQADPSYMKLYQDELCSFMERLKKRGKDKRDDALREYEAEEKEKRVKESPGGLDPQEVFETLPLEMQEAFRTQNIPKMYEAARTMDIEVFQYHLQRCIDSGLWIPDAKEKEQKEKENHE